MIQEQIMHENKFHDKHFPALVTSTRVSKLSKVVDSGCLFFGDPDFVDDDAADDEDVATVDEDGDDDDGEVCFRRSVKMLMQLVATAMKDYEWKEERGPRGGPLHNAAGRDTESPVVTRQQQQQQQQRRRHTTELIR